LTHQTLSAIHRRGQGRRQIRQSDIRSGGPDAKPSPIIAVSHSAISAPAPRLAQPQAPLDRADRCR
jgi:hypothetical protein